MLYLDGIIYNIQRYGGISTYFTELERGLFRHGFDFSMLKYDKNISNSLNVESRKSRIFERYLPINNISNHSILHSSYYRYSQNNKVKNVITVYDFTYEKYSKYPKKGIHVLQKRIALNNADLIFCISENTKNDLFYYYPDAKNKLVLVTHLAASKMYTTLTTSIEERHSHAKVLFVGARSGYKNFIEVVKSLRSKKKYFLQIVGGGPLSNEELGYLNKYLYNRFEHFLNIDNNQLNFLYNNAFCLVYPSLYEGFGIPILEAMSAGCPVIATNISSIPEVAGKSAILLDSPVSDEISFALDKLAVEKVYCDIVHSGILNSKSFTWEKTVEMTIDGYKKLV